MAVTVDWLAKVITVPTADLTLIGSGVYELDIDVFRKTLKSLEEGEGLPFLDTHRHNTAVQLGGLTLARTVEIINGYTVTFEDGQYAVNLVGANSNIADVTNVNQVSVRPQNSAGLVQVTSGSGLSVEEQKKLDEVWRIHGLKSGEPLAVSDTARQSGDISQTIVDNGTTTTVTRT